MADSASIEAKEPGYAAARTLAPILEAHFQRQHGGPGAEDASIAPLPPAGVIERIIAVGFWASLRREEGRVPRISLAYVGPDTPGHPLKFEKRIPFSPRALTRVAPAVERPGIHLGVWHHGNDLEVWGTTRWVPSYCFVLEVVDAGYLVVKRKRTGEFGKFANVAVLEGDEVRVVDEQGASLPDCPPLLGALLDFNPPGMQDGSVNVLVQVAASMRAHRRGGSLLMVPRDSAAWRRSIVHPVSYSVAPPFSELAELMIQQDRASSDPAWQESVRRSVDALAGLTAVDGATVINDRFELLAFGAKIARPDGSSPVERVVVTEPVVGDRPRRIHPAQLGGTRHLSGAQFAHDQRDAVALVASQDGQFTIFAWSHCEEAVHAHRVESLLL